MIRIRGIYMKKKEQKTVDNLVKENNEESKVENLDNNVGIKDYKFVIILLVVIAVFAFSMPLIFKGIKKLEESNFIDNLFSKNNSVPVDNVENKTPGKAEIVNADKSGANAPVLKDGMIPVRYNYIEKKWVKANADNPDTNSWYNYAKKEWANAILVRENGTKTREFYENAKPDTMINDEDILAFYVWIPRYKYSIVSSTGLQQIDISFEEKTATKTTGPNYITHPAFTFDGNELAGIWVGKFEVTGDFNNLTILPNRNAVVNQSISNMFNAIKGFYGSYYGLNSETTNLRLIKNSEWGAIVYLTNSKYGICRNKECSEMSTYNFDYSSDAGVNSSTTGNVTGVYAMNGSAMEYVMGNNNSVVGESGFDSVWMSESKKYYDNYTNGSETEYTRGISGDATVEFGPFNNGQSSWNNSFSKFVTNDNPWFFRDINNSIYSFSSYTGGPHYQVGFRLSLS